MSSISLALCTLTTVPRTSNRLDGSVFVEHKEVKSLDFRSIAIASDLRLIVCVIVLTRHVEF